MRDTLNDVLSIQKIEEGKLELEKTWFSVRESFTRVASTLKGSLSDKQIVLSITIHPSTPLLVFGDNHRIQVRECALEMLPGS